MVLKILILVIILRMDKPICDKLVILTKSINSILCPYTDRTGSLKMKKRVKECKAQEFFHKFKKEFK